MAARDDNQIVPTTFKPSDHFRQIPDHHRYIWHIIPEPGAKQVRLWNELHLSQLVVINPNGATVCAAEDLSVRSLIVIEPRADGTGYSLISALCRTPLSASGLQNDLNGRPLAALPSLNNADPMRAAQAMSTINQYNFRSWNFVPITSVLSGPLVNMPKCALAPGVLTDLNSVDAMKSQVLSNTALTDRFRTANVAYQPGQAGLRMRMISYGPIFFVISDSSRRVIDYSTQGTLDMSEMIDHKHWLMIANNRIVSLYDMTPKYWQVIVGIDDIAERLKPWYIILGQSSAGYPIVLSVGPGNTVIAAPYDPFDSNQLWKYYDWGSSEFQLKGL